MHVIGLFDSGSGGLTILQSCRQALPNEDFVYLGDHANMPYGPRSSREILQFTQDGVDALFKQGCKLVLLACNTAAAVALRTLQQTWLPAHWPDRNILGVLAPTVEEITGVAWTRQKPNQASVDDDRTVLLFATSKTVRSMAYDDELKKRAPRLTLVQKACPGLVEAIEKGAKQEQVTPLVERYVGEAMASLEGRVPDAVVLGCTHFPLVRAVFEAALPPGVPLYCQPSLVAASLQRYLASHPQYARADKAAVGSMRLLTTADPARLHGLEQILPSGYANFSALEQL